MKLESQLSQALCRRARVRLPGAVVIKHNDASTAGVPDISITWHTRTTWLEVKRGKRFNDQTSQHITMVKLAQQGRAYYVMYHEDATVVLLPNGEVFCSSSRPADHDFVIEFVLMGLNRARA